MVPQLTGVPPIISQQVWPAFGQTVTQSRTKQSATFFWTVLYMGHLVY
jgi:hypothetical protein